MIRYLISVGLFIFFASTKAFAVNIDVMVLYTSEFKNINNPALFVQNYINYSNQAFVNSQIDIRFRLKHHQELILPNSATVTADLRNRVAHDSSVRSLRDTYRPDVVVYLTRASQSLCGVAYFPEGTMNPRSPDVFVSTRPEMAFFGVSVVDWASPNCGTFVFAHEIGHNLGAGHGPVDQEIFSYFDGDISYTDRDHRGKPIESSRGHGVRDVFRTIMAYPDVFGSAPVLAFHSNPLVSYYGLPTGTSSRNNAKGMYEIASKYVQSYSTCYPTITTRSTNPRFPGDIISCGPISRYCTEWGVPYTVMVGRVQQTITPCLKYNLD